MLSRVRLPNILLVYWGNRLLRLLCTLVRNVVAEYLRERA